MTDLEKKAMAMQDRGGHRHNACSIFEKQGRRVEAFILQQI